MCYIIGMQGQTYSLDLRQRVVDYVLKGGKRKEACAVFQVSPGSVYNWVKQHRLTGDLSPKPKGSRPWKLDHAAVLRYFEEHIDATLQEAADHFDTAHSVIDYILRKNKVTRKKNHPVRRAKRRR